MRSEYWSQRWPIGITDWSMLEKEGYLAAPTMRQRSRRTATTPKRTRNMVRVCIGEGSSVWMEDNFKVSSARENDRRSVARRMTGRKNNMIGTNIRNML